VTVLERRVTIAFVVTEAAVLIEGIFYGGRDFEATFRDRKRTMSRPRLNVAGLSKLGRCGHFFCAVNERLPEAVLAGGTAALAQGYAARNYLRSNRRLWRPRESARYACRLLN
jgi:hypothetical protein